ncbi:hypothetical protein DKX38_022828 [Salix brachista]|uniref:Exostosin GT47 domain-containing protein n=1 Tax=Salix brachista TaxID=2182728 RepID=A0A5N5K0J7_9ROSI|nr:hypothetical protein DKX38_022828 [Salix brachista]
MLALKELAALVIVLGIASTLLQHWYWLPLPSKANQRLFKGLFNLQLFFVCFLACIFLLRFFLVHFLGSFEGQFQFLTLINVNSILYVLQHSTAGVHHSEEFFLLNYEAMEKDLRDDLPRYKEMVIQNYVRTITIKYPYWNRTLGADHFFVSCHGIGNRATAAFPFLLKNAFRLVCSPGYDSNYIPHKDVSLPQILELSVPPEGDDIWNDSTMESLPIQLTPVKIHPPR